MESLLQVSNLSVSYSLPGGMVPALNGVSFAMGQGEAVGLLGESGSGKSTLMWSIVGLLPKAAALSGSVRFRGQELLGETEQELRRVRGAEIAIIPQEPALALNPVISIGAQVADVIAAHRPWPGARCRQEARQILAEVGLAHERIFSAYPHQLSGGQRQRVAIAQALACGPSLVIADEPTTSLDAKTQSELLELMRRLHERRGMALLMISHDPAVLAEIAQRVLVLRAGRVIESGAIASVFGHSTSEYTKSLLRSLPQALAADHST
jgi:ABC-type glutathione transport system ATPase component